MKEQYLILPHEHFLPHRRQFIIQRGGIHTRFWRKSQKERDRWEDLYVNEKIILKGLLEIYDGVLWAGLIRLRIGTSGGLL
jgi:hypothetical protein